MSYSSTETSGTYLLHNRRKAVQLLISAHLQATRTCTYLLEPISFQSDFQNARHVSKREGKGGVRYQCETLEMEVSPKRKAQVGRIGACGNDEHFKSAHILRLCIWKQ